MPLQPADFFAALRKNLKQRLPAGLRNFSSSRGRGRLMKVHYGEPAFHFEAWHHTGAGRLEVGLHFEASAAENEAAFEFFRARIVAVKASLPRAELEPWDRGWSRLYETLPAPRLDEKAQAAAVDLLVGYIEALQPMVLRFLEE